MNGKRIVKRIFSLLVAITIFMSVVPYSIMADKTTGGSFGSGLIWNLSNDGVLIISGNGEMPDFNYRNPAPWEEFWESVVKVVVEEGVTTIGNEAFCDFTYMKSIEIPAGITKIGNSAFEFCEELSEVILPDSVISIGDNAFYYCEKLQYIFLGEKVESIGESALGRCAFLSDIGVSERNKSFSSVDGNLLNKDKTVFIRYASSKQELEYVVESTVTKIENEAFTGSSYLKEIYIGENVAEIGRNVFEGCNRLNAINVDVNNEQYCSVDGNLYSKDKTVFLQFALGKTDAIFAVPDNVKTIGESAFDGASRIEEVILPQSLTKIERCAFFSCYNLLKITIPEGVTAIGDQAFAYCESLGEIEIPKLVTTIEFSTFEGCESLTTVTIGSGVMCIEDDAFLDCEELVKVIYAGNEDLWNEIRIESDDDRVLLEAVLVFDSDEDFETVLESGNITEKIIWSITSEGFLSIEGEGSMPDFSNATSVPWAGRKSKIERVVVGEGITNVPDYAFYSCSSLREISLPKSLEIIGKNSFLGCKSLTEIDLPDNLKTLKANAFENCVALEQIIIPSEVTSIGANAFKNCTELKSAELPESIIVIENGIFMGCENLKEISVDSENDYFCSYNGNLYTKTMYELIAYAAGKPDAEYTLPNATRMMYPSAFSGAKKLKNIYLHEYVLAVTPYVFSGCYGVENIFVDDKHEQLCDIDGNLFNKEKDTLIYYCHGRKNEVYTMPDGVITIGQGAFEQCDNIKKVVLADQVKQICEKAFYGCDLLETLSVGLNITWINNEAFYGCESLAKILVRGNKFEWKMPTAIGQWNSEFTNAQICYEEKVEDDIIAEGSCSDSIGWKLYGNGKMILSGNGQMPEADNSEFGWNKYAEYIKEVVIEEGITSIAEGAFDCGILCDIEKLLLPESLKTIGKRAFYGNMLTEIIIPDGVETIGASAFVPIPGLDGYNRAGDGPTKISIGKKLRDMGSLMLDCGTDITEILVADDNPYMCSVDGNLFNKDMTKLIKYSVGKNDAEYVIPDTVVEIGNSAFSGCDSLETVSFSMVETIEEFAFAYCEKLKKVSMGNVLNSINENVFYYCSSLEEIVIPQTVEYIGKEAFFVCPELRIVTMGNKIRTIGEKAFGGCKSLETIYFNGKIQEWDAISKANWYETGVYSQFEPAELMIFYETDKSNAFVSGLWWSLGLNGELTLFTGTVEALIAPWSEWSGEIKSVVINEDIYKIGEGVFALCTGIEDVYFKGTSVQWKYVVIDDGNAPLENATRHYMGDVIIVAEGVCGDNLTWTLTNGGVLTISGTGSMYNYFREEDDAYLGNPWDDAMLEHIETLIVEYGVTTIGSGAFYWCENLTSIDLPSSVQSIGTRAFYACNIKKIEIPGSVKTINKFAFYANAPESIVLHNGIEHIEEGAFYGMRVDVVLPDTLKTIGDYAFGLCANKTLILPNSVETVGEWAFYHSSMDKVVIGENLKNLGNRAFSDCMWVQEIEVDEDNEHFCTIDGHLYTKDKSELVYYCINADNSIFKVPDGVKTIGAYSFYNLDSYIGIPGKIEHIILPDSVTRIDEGAFENLKSLERIDVGEGVENIARNAFAGSGIPVIYLPETLKYIGVDALDTNTISDIYYAGTEEQWGIIAICDESEYFKNAVVHYNSEPVGRNPMVIFEINSEILEVSSVYVPNESKVMPVFYTNDAAQLGELISTDGNVNKYKYISGCDAIKIFVWDSWESMNPLCEAVVVK